MKWKTTIKKLSELTPINNNPRTITKKEIKRLSKSIKEQGFFDPLVCDIDGSVLSGNQRYRVLQAQGATEVEVTMPEKKLSEKQRKKIILLGNDHNGEFNIDVLANEFEEAIRDLELDFNLPELEPEVYEDDFEEPQEKNIHNVQRGDIWQLGDHKLMCGDATSIEDVEKLMDGVKADMVFTDPPYGMSLNTDFSGMKSKLFKGKTGRGSYSPVIGDDKQYDPTHLMDLAPEIITWGADYYADKLPKGGSWFVWDKRLTEGADKMWGSGFELAWSKAPHKRDIVRVKWAGIFGMQKSDTSKRVHPTQKPVELVTWFFNRIKGDIVLDLFGGSGTTLIACEQTNRKCYMMELDEHYCSVIIERFEKLTGKKAVKM